MKKYDVPLALASTGYEGKIALARMIIDMMERKELYEPLEYEGTFVNLGELDDVVCFKVLGIDPRERSERLEDEFTLRNYDVALALATAGDIEGSRRVMEAVDPKKELDVSDFESLERYEREKAMEIRETRKLQDRLFKLLRYKNLPHPETPREDKTYLREIVVGWRRLGIECLPRYEKHAESLSEKLSGEVWRSFEKQMELGLVDRYWFNKMMRKELSKQKNYGGHGAWLPGKLKFIDYVVCDAGDVAWIIEGKKKLNYEAIGQVKVYSDLFTEDNPTFSEVRKAIVCEETEPVLEATCEKNNIEIITDI